MLASKMVGKDGWDIFTMCREDNPGDWKPGDPIRFTAHGFADFARPHNFIGSYSDKSRQNYPASGTLHFYDFNEAHNTIETELRAVIEALKVA